MASRQSMVGLMGAMVWDKVAWSGWQSFVFLEDWFLMYLSVVS